MSDKDKRIQELILKREELQRKLKTLTEEVDKNSLNQAIEDCNEEYCKLLLEDESKDDLSSWED